MQLRHPILSAPAHDHRVAFSTAPACHHAVGAGGEAVALGLLRESADIATDISIWVVTCTMKQFVADAAPQRTILHADRCIAGAADLGLLDRDVWLACLLLGCLLDHCGGREVYTCGVRVRNSVCVYMDIAA